MCIYYETSQISYTSHTCEQKNNNNNDMFTHNNSTTLRL